MSRGRLTSRAAWWATFLAFAVIGTTWSLSNAPMNGPDEPDHLRKAAAVVRGQFQTEATYTDGAFMSFPMTEVRVPRAYGYQALLDLLECWNGRLAVATSCAAPPPDDAGPVERSPTYVGSYPPTYYLVAGWPTRVLGPRNALYAARVVGALVGAALLASAFASLRTAGGGPLTIMGTAAAITPMTLLLLGSVNPNGIEVAAAVGVWAALLALLTSTGPPATRLLVRAGVASALLVGVRPLSPAFFVIIATAAMLAVGTRSRLHELWADRAGRITGIAVAAVLAVTTAFVLVNRSITSVIRFQQPPRSGWGRFTHAVGTTPTWLDQAMGVLGWLGFRNLSVPDPWRIAWWVVIAAVVVAGLVTGTARVRLVLVGVAAFVLVLPVVAGITRPESLWQGRYLLPVMVGIPMLAGWSADRSPMLGDRFRRRTAVGGICVLAAGQVAAHQQLMTRQVLGLPNGLLANLSGGAWSGPLTPKALLGLALLGALLFGATLVACIVRPPESTTEARGTTPYTPPP